MPRSIHPAFSGRGFVTEFIKIYREQPSLWNVHDDDYKDPKKMSEGYKKLMDLMRVYKDKVTLHECKSKIASLRAAYRKERHKVRDTGGDHKPKLWFYSLLTFVDICEQKSDNSEEVKNYDSSGDGEQEFVDSTDLEPSQEFSFETKDSENEMPAIPLLEEDVSSIERKKKRKRKLLRNLKSGNVVSSLAKVWVPRIEKPDDRLVDDCDVVGVNVANKLRKMDYMQRLLAEELINATLTQGLMGELTRATGKHVKREEFGDI